jgi:Asp-tRNA(Asn)/Glu-tRNA(Gln) amidotransferase A subunit family amidase
MKPSKGRVTYGPDVGDELIGMSTQHVLTRSMRDSAALMDATAMPDYGDPYWAPPAPESYLRLLDRDPKPLRIALCTRPPIATDVHPDCIAAATETAKLLESLGHIVEEADHGVRWEEDGLAHASTVILGVGMYASVKSKAALKGLAEVNEADFLPAIWSFLEAGRAASSADFYLACRKAHETGRRLAAFHKKYDVILSPTLSQPPLPRASFDYTTSEGYTEHVWDFSAYTPLYNVTGQPALTLPLYWTRDGLPVGVQFAARFGGEDILYQLGGQIERAAPWANRIPDLALVPDK